jgi:hypothetical protein
MARYALIVGASVDNIVICENDELANQLWPSMIAVNLDVTGQFTDIGWIYVDGEFSPPPTGSGAP